VLEVKEFIFLLVSIAIGWGITHGNGLLLMFCSSLMFNAVSVRIEPH